MKIQAPMVVRSAREQHIHGNARCRNGGHVNEGKAVLYFEPHLCYDRRMQNLTSRAYCPEDFNACMSIFDSNVPLYFSPMERDEFVEFLAPIGSTETRYLVLTLSGSIIACGGLSINKGERTASLSWGMVDRAYHRCRLGSQLLNERLKLARSSDVVEVVLATSQHTFGFYEHYGFTTLKITANGFAAGLDRYDMRLRLQ